MNSLKRQEQQDRLDLEERMREEKIHPPVPRRKEFWNYFECEKYLIGIRQELAGQQDEFWSYLCRDDLHNGTFMNIDWELFEYAKKMDSNFEKYSEYLEAFIRNYGTYHEFWIEW